MLATRDTVMPPPTGLTAAEARVRLETEGPNELPRAVPVSALAIFGRQLNGIMVWLLAGATVLSAVLGEIGDAVAIGVILLLNATVGFLQELRAERSVDALRALGAPRARVRREGHATEVPAREVVRGDLVILEAGDRVAADARLVEAETLTTNEAVLTGESLPSEKTLAPSTQETPLAERSDRVFMGTTVASGVGLAEVTATGRGTELGRIAHLLSTAKAGPTPLQVHLERVGRVLLVGCGVIVALVGLLGLMRGRPFVDALMTALSLAVAAVPEGLTAIVTIALALGVQRMAARHVLVRRLAAVETLGCATVICTDKTGTLTSGVMQVRETWGADRQVLLDAAAACCDADLGASGSAATGDATELAILRAAAAAGIDRSRIEADRPRLHELPFDSIRKRMAIQRADGKTYVKGAVESLLPLCRDGQEGAVAATTAMAERGMRVLAVGVGGPSGEEDLTLLGLIGFSDPPRPEATAAVAAAREAGIAVVMVTGDHPTTAWAIAREMGIVTDAADGDRHVHARTTPEGKLALVRAWKDRGAVVAMTGDGVNDAPALREAHIGIAMGRGGSDVAREAAAMVLTDDNFASIVAAIREGRGIFENIRKALVYLLAGNVSELLLMLGGALWGLPVPLLPVQILWVNLVTDGLPALALVADPADPRVLERAPRSPREPLLDRPRWRSVALIGLLEGTLVLVVYALTLGWGAGGAGTQAQARTMAFTVLVFSELFRAFSARSPDRLFWEVGPFSNLRLLFVVLVTVGLQVGLLYISGARRLLSLSALTPSTFGLALLAGLIPVSVLEIAKLARRWRRR